MPPRSSCQRCAAGPRRGTLAGAATRAPLAWSCWGNVSHETSQVHWALSLALAHSMTLTWSWTAVVTHVSNDSTQLSDQHYATVRSLWLQQRDEGCDRAPSLIWVRDGGGWPTSLKGRSTTHTTFSVLTAFDVYEKTQRISQKVFQSKIFLVFHSFIYFHLSLDEFIFKEHTSRI